MYFEICKVDLEPLKFFYEKQHALQIMNLTFGKRTLIILSFLM